MQLGHVLPTITIRNQGAFIKGRQLAYNISIVQDFLWFYGRFIPSTQCMRKFDMSREYDIVAWNFVHDLLHALVFPTRFIAWVMACLCNAHYILLGRIQGEFMGEKGFSREIICLHSSLFLSWNI